VSWIRDWLRRWLGVDSSEYYRKLYEWCVDQDARVASLTEEVRRFSPVEDPHSQFAPVLARMAELEARQAELWAFIPGPKGRVTPAGTPPAGRLPARVAQVQGRA